MICDNGTTHHSKITKKPLPAAQPVPAISGRIGLREWLDGASPDLRGLPTATFDTSVARPRLPGSAARVLLRRGCRSIGAPESFYLTSTSGPLADGERERARRWGNTVAATITAGPPV